MFSNLKFDKDKLSRLLIVLSVSAIVFLTISLMTDSGHKRQISDDNESTEDMLCSILSDIEGVGDVSVMIDYDDKDNVTGVIVTCQGGDSSTARNNVVKGVSSLFNIPVSNVTVFSKNKGEKNENKKD